MNLEDLTQTLIRTVVDPTEWERALPALCAATGADKALVALRQNASADIVIPEVIAEEHNGPLIHGFTEDAVAGYLMEYMAIDPWTAIEKANHPYFPYALSNHISREDLQHTPFWKWLEPLGIDDTIVCEIGRSGDYWASLNLYFGETTPKKAERIRDRLKTILPVLKAVWASSREVQLAKLTEGAIESLLANVAAPAILIGADGRIRQVGAAAMPFTVPVFGQSVRVGDAIRFPQDLHVIVDEPDLPFQIERSKQKTAFRGSVMLTAHAPAQLASGEPGTGVLMTIFETRTEAPNAQGDIWDHSALTERERTLVRMIAEDRLLKEAQEIMGISRPRVMQLWKSAREKLDIADANDLRVAHRVRRAS